MKRPARIYASQELLQESLKDRSLEQLINVATLPGLQKYALAMPDIHEGYGFPVGGVAATKLPDGIISPGGIGYDINCGVRLLASPLTFTQIKSQLSELADAIYQHVPSGLGRGGAMRLDKNSLDKVLSKGAQTLVEKGYGFREDLIHCEAFGNLQGANPDKVSSHAKQRGADQLGTIGSGNHFVEVQRVEVIFDEGAAKALGLFKNQVLIMIHTGSRGLGHQNATDYIRLMIKVMSKYGINLPDRELAGVPLNTQEGSDYFASMVASANFAWANRQLITHRLREAWQKTFNQPPESLRVVYDVAHNIAKKETYEVDGKKTEVIVHRKGATRSFGPENPEIAEAYRHLGQPVLIPGSMGTASYVLIGQNVAMEESFGTSCHGAGRAMSRTRAKQKVRGSELKIELEKQGIAVRAGSMSGLAEEAPIAYKNVDRVVEVVHQAGIAKKVARLVPIGVVKG